MFKKLSLYCLEIMSTIILVQSNLSYALNNQNYEITSASNYDAEALLYGIEIDKDYWDVRWNNNYLDIKTTWDEDIYGLTDIHIGAAFYKEQINGMYRTSIIYAIKTMPKNVYKNVHHQVLWHGWDEQILQFGVLSYVNVKSNINESSAKIVDSYPKYIANSTSYSISSEYSASTSGIGYGIGASVSFSENAIDITNKTNSSDKYIDIKISRNTKSDNSQTKKQMAQENWWYFRYDCLTDSKYLKQEISVVLQYQLLEDVPENNPSVWRTSTLTWKLNVI